MRMFSGWRTLKAQLEIYAGKYGTSDNCLSEKADTLPRVSAWLQVHFNKLISMLLKCIQVAFSGKRFSKRASGSAFKNVWFVSPMSLH